MKKKCLDFFNSILQQHQIIDGLSEKAKYFLQEKRNNFNSEAMLILLPKNTIEVSKIVKFCSDNNISIVPQSGNTGLSGGGVALNNQIIINSSLMNNIINLDKKNYSMTLESGVILGDAQEYAKQEGILFPLNLPSKNTCQIGGNLASNAGGINVIKYGNTRDLCLGIEVVLPDGTIYSDLNKLRKRNIGPDIKHLFIGSEGVLGFITKAVFKVFPLPKTQLHLLFSSPNLNQIQEIYNKIYNDFDDLISSFEIFNHTSLKIVQKYHSIKLPDTVRSNKWYSISCINLPFVNEKIVEQIRFLICSYFPKSTGFFLSENPDIWKIRNLIPDSQRLYSKSLKHDISVPLSRITNFITEAEEALAEKFPSIGEPVIFGHMGDGNLHFNIAIKENYNLKDFEKIKINVKNIIVEKAMKHYGNFSAEHGIGLIHKQELKYFYPDNQYKMLLLLKQTLDPKNIFNPNKLIN